MAIACFWFKVPETKNRPLEDIEREIGGEELTGALSGDDAGTADGRDRSG